MQVVYSRNINDAFLLGVDLLNRDHVIEESRAGKVYVHPEPVTTVYGKPKERVLFNSERNANPFFHFAEGLWMLTGKNDLKTMEYYNKRMAEYSEDGKILWGAYGWRWKSYFQFDQLELIIDKIINAYNKGINERRLVLQMWDPKGDLPSRGPDVPCNTTIYFKMDVKQDKLDMTVCNRSNDIIWGAYGANVVHMSMLHEYVARFSGLEVGKYYQVSNNFHSYVDKFNPLFEELEARDTFDFYTLRYLIDHNPYKIDKVKPFDMASNSISKETWDKELNLLLEGKRSNFEEPFFELVAVPILNSWDFYKRGQVDQAILEIQDCHATDWCRAGLDWLSQK